GAGGDPARPPRRGTPTPHPPSAHCRSGARRPDRAPRRRSSGLRGASEPERGLPRLLGGDLLGPGPHEGPRARIARVALERIALEETAAPAHANGLLGH